jgi:hypothetical protein
MDACLNSPQDDRDKVLATTAMDSTAGEFSL